MNFFSQIKVLYDKVLYNFYQMYLINFYNTGKELDLFLLLNKSALSSQQDLPEYYYMIEVKKLDRYLPDYKYNQLGMSYR